MRIRFNMTPDQIKSQIEVTSNLVGSKDQRPLLLTSAELLFDAFVSRLRPHVSQALQDRVSLLNPGLRVNVIDTIVNGAENEAYLHFFDQLKEAFDDHISKKPSSLELSCMALVKTLESSANNFLDHEVNELRVEAHASTEWQLLKREVEMA
jgi:hypothetical protein